MKLLMSRYTRHRIMLLVSGVVMALSLAAVMIFHADPASPDNEPGDYTMCKLFALMPMVLCADLPVMFMSQEFQGSRFMRSVPGAGRLYGKSVPVFCSLVVLAWSLVVNVPYAAFILLSGRELVNISDMLVICSAVLLLFSVITCCMLSFRGGVYFVVLFYLPVTLIGAVFGIVDGPIGLPLWAAVLMFAGAFAAGLAVNFIISRLAYNNINFREFSYMQSR